LGEERAWETVSLGVRRFVEGNLGMFFGEILEMGYFGLRAVGLLLVCLRNTSV